MEQKSSLTLPEKYIRNFEKFTFGMFIHWGLYSILGSGEWVQHYRNIPADDYEKLKEHFTAECFDPKEWVKLAKKAGMKYVCMTTRHHEGFSLYDTRGLNDFDAPHSAAGRDLVKEFSDACHELEMPMFFYHTTLDWKMKSFESDWESYISYLNSSVEILCKYYGKVSGFWFDGNWAKKDRDWHEDELYGLIRRYHPDCIIVNNTSIGARGEAGNPEIDVVTFEQGVPDKRKRSSGSKYLASEMCETMNSHWGIARYDFSQKSPGEIIHKLTQCRAAGANLLLNIGPNADGSIPAYETAVLDIVGKWISVYGESLYEGVPTNLICKGQDFILQIKNNYYYFAHRLPIYGNMHLMEGENGAGLRTIQGLLPKVKEIHWMDNNEELTFIQDLEKQMLVLNATPFPYGENYLIRVAKITT